MPRHYWLAVWLCPEIELPMADRVSLAQSLIHSANELAEFLAPEIALIAPMGPLDDGGDHGNH